MASIRGGWDLQKENALNLFLKGRRSVSYRMLVNNLAGLISGNGEAFILLPGNANFNLAGSNLS